jgi:hypothetical protein
MRGIGSDGLSFEFVAPAAIKMAAGLSCLSLFRVIFFVIFLSCYMRASLCLSLYRQSNRKCVGMQVSVFTFSKQGEGKKNKKIFNFSVEGHYHEIITVRA